MTTNAEIPLNDVRRLRVAAEIAIMDILGRLASDTGLDMDVRIDKVAHKTVGGGRDTRYIANINLVI